MFVYYLLVISSITCLFSGCGIGAKEEAQVRSSTSIMCNGNTSATTKLLVGMPKPDQRTGIGNAHLKITTNQEKAQFWFDQGLNYLHGFWYLEAYRAFEQVITIDADCAMGYWGKAMCQPGFGGDDFTQWQSAIDRAQLLAQNCRSVEKGLINALSVTAHEDLFSAKESWKALAENFEEEPEVIAFAAIMMRQVVQNEADSDEIKRILDKALLRFPYHVGLLHYYVHLLEVRPDYALARTAAEKLIHVAPNNSHLVHMPGHLHYLDGDYEAAVKAFEAARTQEQAYHKEQGISPAIDQNYLHNLHYLSIAYSELNERALALEAAKKFASTTLGQGVPTDGAGWMVLYEGRILPALVHIRFGEYKDAAREIGFWLTTPISPIENKLVREYLGAIQNYCFAMDFALANDRQRAIDYANQMVVHYTNFQQQELTGPTEEAMAAQVFDVMTVMRYELAGWLNNLDNTQPFDNEYWSEAMIAEVELPYDEPPRLMYPVAESKARLHLARGEPAEASNALKNALIIRPQSTRIKRLLAII